MRPLFIALVAITVSATISACSFRESPDRGQFTFFPGYDYDTDNSDKPGEENTPIPAQPDGAPR